MHSNYLRGIEPDLDDFFAQIVPQPPPTNSAGGVAFMAPFGPEQGRWFAYFRSGQNVENVEGSKKDVASWLESTPALERWVYAIETASYVRWPPTA